MNRRPQLTDAEVEDLLGAYALDACDPEETMAIEAVLARRPDLAREAKRLAAAATWVGASEALKPPDGHRASVIAAALDRRAGVADPVIDLYLTVAERFERTAEALPEDAYDVATANGLSARDLVVHMAAQESLLAQNLGVPTLDLTDATDIDERTHELLARVPDADVEAALGMWREAVEANRAWAVEHADETASWRGLGLSRNDALTVRAFEEWIHCDDLRRITGLDPAPPAPRHLAVMSELASRLVPLSFDVAGQVREAKTVRLVLTGDGGGDWSVALDGDQFAVEPDVTVTADVIDWCLLVGARLTPDEIRCSIEGDTALGAAVLAAAPALATL